jgi:hypothetical protein
MDQDDFRTGEMTYLGESVIAFSARVAVVDGIESNYWNTVGDFSVHPGRMFDLKYEYHSGEIYEGKDGFIIDRDGNIPWDGEYQPVPLKYGEIDEDIFVKTGLIIGMDDPVYKE